MGPRGTSQYALNQHHPKSRRDGRGLSARCPLQRFSEIPATGYSTLPSGRKLHRRACSYTVKRFQTCSATPCNSRSRCDKAPPGWCNLDGDAPPFSGGTGGPAPLLSEPFCNACKDHRATASRSRQISLRREERPAPGRLRFRPFDPRHRPAANADR